MRWRCSYWKAQKCFGPEIFNHEPVRSHPFAHVTAAWTAESEGHAKRPFSFLNIIKLMWLLRGEHFLRRHMAACLKRMHKSAYGGGAPPLWERHQGMTSERSWALWFLNTIKVVPAQIVRMVIAGHMSQKSYAYSESLIRPTSLIFYSMDNLS